MIARDTRGTPSKISQNSRINTCTNTKFPFQNYVFDVLDISVNLSYLIKSAERRFDNGFISH